jgi:hypothetical protein
MATARNRRTPLRTTRCSWCGQVEVRGLWVPDRRRKRDGAYATVVCRRCRFFYLRGFDLEGFLAWLRGHAG